VNENYLSKEPGRGTFVNNFNNSNKSRKKTGNIFFLRSCHNRKGSEHEQYNSKVCDDIFYPQVIAGIDMVAEEKNYHCIFKYIYEEDIDNKLIKEIQEKADGIICGELHSQKMLDTITKINIPVVLVSPSVINNKIDIIDIDNFNGAYNLIDHLIKMGHREIALIGAVESNRPAIQRKNGFLEALSNKNIHFDKSLYFNNGWKFEDGYQAAEKILKLQDKPTAVFAVSDLLAIGAINCFKDNGYNVPDDISVVGFDDIDMAKQIRPTLTTMKVRKVDMGKEAADLIFNKIDGKQRNYSIRITVPTEFMKRNSVKEL
ncbi:MAG: substrate-binding domain-containing protein, partial [Halanaerobiales bacterium]